MNDSIKRNVKYASAISEIHDLSIDWNGWNFLTVFGKDPDGWFLAIPNWETCVEIAPPDNIKYNSEKIGKALGKPEAGSVIAEEIKEYFRR